jgi:hypothetical protein
MKYLKEQTLHLKKNVYSLRVVFKFLNYVYGFAFEVKSTDSLLRWWLVSFSVSVVATALLTCYQFTCT